MRRALLCLVLAALLCGCAGVSGAPAEGDGKLSVVATVFPLYDWTRNLLGASETVELTLLLDGGVDGLDFYRAICEKWREALRPYGKLLFEVGIGQADTVLRMMRTNGFGDVQIIPDLNGIPRVVYGTRWDEV